ncbi:Dihydrofolate synthase/folylpolyglutamate synthase [bacterium HR17]|uniref:tetrahydrofolate synthase n=1 Tax=Candidatus Fervidibacter japonicus TaxID=2035412 RepID=A0A2H5X8L1_9BACT|nr:Dihydrofolate synthase/folylpolyglutamate synthase [bacterium HR17]
MTAESYLKTLQRFGIKPGLERIRAMMAWAGEPHLQFPSVLIGGTNGKGSVAAFLAAILQAAGYRVGIYTSPHLVDYRERFRINETPITPDRFAQLLEWAKGLAERVERETPHGAPTEFEVLTAVAFRYFADERVDIAVVEVGLGGRWDATNVLEPRISVVTMVALDHTDRLGPDHFTIARDKLGIARPYRPLVTAEHKWGVLRLFEETALHLKARWVRVGNEVIWQLHRADADGTDATFTTWRGRYRVHLNLLGTHQLPNFGCALAAAELLRDEGWAISADAIAAGAQRAHLQGRLQLVCVPSAPCPILLDGAHNPSGATILGRALRTLFRYRRLHLVLGILADKDVDGVIAKLVPLADEVFATQPHTARALPVDGLAEKCALFGKRVRRCAHVADALHAAAKEAQPDDLICVTGSLYLVGDALAVLTPPPSGDH